MADRRRVQPLVALPTRPSSSSVAKPSARVAPAVFLPRSGHAPAPHSRSSTRSLSNSMVVSVAVAPRVGGDKNHFRQSIAAALGPGRLRRFSRSWLATTPPANGSGWLRELRGLIHGALLVAVADGGHWHWRQSVALIAETLWLGLISNATALGMAAIARWCNPFVLEAATSDPRGQVRFAAFLAGEFCAVGMISSAIVTGFFLRGRCLRQSKPKDTTTDAFASSNVSLNINPSGPVDPTTTTTAVGPGLTFAQCTALTLRMSWAGAVGGIVVAVGGIYAALSRVNTTFFTYNGPTVCIVIGVTIHVVVAMVRVVRFRLTKTIADPRHRVTAPASRHIQSFHPRGGTPRQGTRRIIRRQSSRQPRRRSSASSSKPRLSPVAKFRRSAVRTLAVAVPAVVVAMLAIQFVAFGKRLDFDTEGTALLFSAGSLVLKFVFQLIVKGFIWHRQEHDGRNVFYMIAAPIVIVEIQIRMTLLRAQSTLSIYMSAGILAGAEILVRVATVVLDFMALELERRHVERRKAQLRRRGRVVIGQSSGSRGQDCGGGDGDPAFRDGDDRTLSRDVNAATAGLLAEAETHFREWKTHHLRLCAIEIRAEILSEYCGLAFASIITAVLNGSSSFALLGSTGLAGNAPQHNGGSGGSTESQVAAFLVQLGFELVADVVASAVEMRLGIPLVDAISPDERSYIAWVVFVAAVHAGGICISSFLADPWRSSGSGR